MSYRTSTSNPRTVTVPGVAKKCDYSILRAISMCSPLKWASIQLHRSQLRRLQLNGADIERVPQITYPRCTEADVWLTTCKGNKSWFVDDEFRNSDQNVDDCFAPVVDPDTEPPAGTAHPTGVPEHGAMHRTQ